MRTEEDNDGYEDCKDDSVTHRSYDKQLISRGDSPSLPCDIYESVNNDENLAGNVIKNHINHNENSSTENKKFANEFTKKKPPLNIHKYNVSQSFSRSSAEKSDLEIVNESNEELSDSSGANVKSFSNVNKGCKNKVPDQLRKKSLRRSNDRSIENIGSSDSFESRNKSSSRFSETESEGVNTRRSDISDENEPLENNQRFSASKTDEMLGGRDNRQLGGVPPIGKSALSLTSAPPISGSNPPSTSGGKTLPLAPIGRPPISSTGSRLAPIGSSLSAPGSTRSGNTNNQGKTVLVIHGLLVSVWHFFLVILVLN